MVPVAGATWSHGAVDVRVTVVPGFVALTTACRTAGEPASGTSTRSAAWSKARVFVSFAVVKAVWTTWVAPTESRTSVVIVWSPSGSCLVSNGAAACATEPGPKSNGAAESVRSGWPVRSGSSSHHVVEETPSVWARKA